MEPSFAAEANALLRWLLQDAYPCWWTRGADLVHGGFHESLQRFRDPASGFVREYFNHDWNPMPGADGRIVEPGHQYEWAWLLLRWSRHSQQAGAFDAALELIELAERHGVDAKRGVAIDELFTDGAVRNPRARLWPQTERIKAACLAAVLTGNSRYSRIAQQGARSLMKYFTTPLAGLWHDKMNEDGAFVAEHSPASSLYHIASAILELQRATRALEHRPLEGAYPDSTAGRSSSLHRVVVTSEAASSARMSSADAYPCARG